MQKILSKQNLIYVLFVLCAGLLFFIRAWTITSLYNFASSGDQAGFVLSSLRIFNIFNLNNDFHQTLKEIVWVINFSWGYFQIVFSFIGICIISLLKIPICEWTIYMPYVVFSVFTGCNIFNLLRKEINNIYFAFLFAIIIGCVPGFVTTSRSNLNWHLSFCLLINTLIFLCNYIHNIKKSYYAYLSFIFLSLYIIADSQFMAIFLILIYAVYLIVKRQNINLFDFYKKFPKKTIILPMITFVPIIIAFIYFSYRGKSDYGFFGHNIEKKFIFGFYIKDIFKEYILTSGLLLTFIIPIGFCYGVYSLCKRKIISIFFITFIFYCLPWIFLIHRSQGGGKNSFCYILNFSIPLIMLSLIGVFKVFLYIFKNKVFFRIIVISISLFFLIEEVLIIGKTVWGINYSLPYYKFTNTYGVVVPRNRALKPLAIYIRENIDANSMIFSHLEPTSARYLFNRKVYGIYDISKFSQESLFNEFLKYKDKIDVIVLNKKYFELLKNVIIKDFSLQKKIIIENLEFYILFKGLKSNKIEEIVLENNYNVFFHEFDEKYGKVKLLKWPLVWEKID